MEFLDIISKLSKEDLDLLKESLSGSGPMLLQGNVIPEPWKSIDVAFLIDSKNNFTGNESVVNNLFSEDVKKQLGFPSDLLSYMKNGNNQELVRNRVLFLPKTSPLIKQMQNEQASRGRTTISVISAGKAASIASSYYQELDRLLLNKDALQTITVSPCPQLSMANSPYEIYKKAYEQYLVKGGPEPDPVQVLSNFTSTEQFDDISEKAEVASHVLDIQKYWRESLGQAGYDPDLFKRGERLASGTSVALKLGTVGGSYGKDLDVIKESQDKGYSTVADYKDDQIELFTPPNELYTLLNLVTNDEGKPLATDGKEIDYDFPGIDEYTSGKRKPMILPESERIERIKSFLKKIEPDLKQFPSEFELVKKSLQENIELQKQGKSGNVLYKMKPKVLSAFFAGVLALEAFKLGKIESIVQTAIADNKIPPSFSDLYHEMHNLSAIVGYAEMVLNSYKVVTGISNGKVGDPLRDLGLGVIGFLAEFYPSVIGLDVVLPSLVRAGAGGWVGILLTLTTTFIDFVAKPFAKKKNSKILDSILDLERMWIEKNCCIRLHPNLYRKTKGQALIPLMTSDDPNSIDGVTIPAGSTYGTGFEPNTVPVLPCVQGQKINAPKQIGTVRRSSSTLEKLTPIDQKIAEPIGSEKTDSEKCEKPVKLKGAKTKNPNDLSLNDTIPSWGKSREDDYQNTVFSYNINYIQNEYNSRLQSAYCRSGIIQPGGSNGEIDPSYERGDNLPLYTVFFRKIFRAGVATPLNPIRADKTEWVAYWDNAHNQDENRGGDISDRIKRRGSNYGGGRGGKVGKKPWETEDLGDLPEKV